MSRLGLTPPLQIVRRQEYIAYQPSATRPDAAWTILGEVGLLLAVVGGVDLLLAWYPSAFGNPEWEFGTVTATFDGLPAPAIGLALVLASALSRGKRTLARAAAVLFGVLGAALLAIAVVYVLTLPLAWRSVSDPLVQQGLLRAIAKTLAQVVAYPAVFLWLAASGWRNTAPVAPHPDS